MSNNTNEGYDFDLKTIIISLRPKISFIATVTGFLTLLAIIYALNLTPFYKSFTSFIVPSESSINIINKLNNSPQTKQTVFSKFLTNLSSEELQKTVFKSGDFLTKFNLNNVPIDNIDKFILEAINSISVVEPNSTINSLKLGYLTEQRYQLEMEGVNGESISSYLDQLVASASSKTINDLIFINEQIISIRLDELNTKRELLSKLALKNRKAKIVRLKEESAEKVREINGKIERVRQVANQNRLNEIVILTEKIKGERQLSNQNRLNEIVILTEKIKAERQLSKQNRLNEIVILTEKIKSIRKLAEQDRLNDIQVLSERIKSEKQIAKLNRLNEIKVLSEQLQIAKSLGIIENHFEHASGRAQKSDSVNIAIGERDLPVWYLYGVNALVEKINTLKIRSNDESFIPELVRLKNELTFLESSTVDDFFIPELVSLKNEIAFLESSTVDDFFIPELVSLKNEITFLESSTSDAYIPGLVNLNNQVNLLEIRSSNDSFVPELIDLLGELNEAKNNNALKTLVERENDDFFIPEISKLDVDILELKSMMINMDFSDPMRIVHKAIVQKIEKNKQLIVLLSFFVSFMFSIVLVLIMDLFKPNEKLSPN